MPAKLSCHSVPRRVPLRTLLIIPFVLQLVLVVGGVWYLSFRNGQEAVNQVAHQLRNEITLRIQNHLSRFTHTLHQLNQIHANAIRQGVPPAEKPKALERYFWEQIQLFPTVTSIYFGNPAGGLVDAGREGAGGDLYVIATDAFKSGPFRKYGTDDQGNRKKLLATLPDFDARKRSWYQEAAKAGKATWNDIYILFTGQDMALSASCPVYDSKQTLLGVVSSDIFLSHVSDFLKGLDIGKTGQCFIMERSGLLVASSTDAPSFTPAGQNSPSTRLYASQSKNRVIQKTARFLSKRFGAYARIPARPQHFEFPMAGQRQFLQVSPFQDAYGLDWLVAVVIPESDFMAQIYANNRTTAVFVLLALIGAMLLGVLTAQGIAQPIFELNVSAQALADNRWDHPIRRSRIREIDGLSRSFAHMATKLKGSLESLSAEVAERKRAEAELRESETNLRSIFEAANNVAFVKTDLAGKDAKIIDFSPGAERIFGYQAAEIIGRPVALLHLPRDVERFPAALQALRENQEGFSGESTLVRKSGKTFPAIFKTYPLFDDQGEMSGAIGVSIDISKRKQAEAELRKMEKLKSIGTLAGGIAHDFNNILLGVFGNISLAKAALDSDDPAFRSLEEAERSMNRATRLTHQLLTFAKGGEPIKADADLGGIVEEVVRFDLSGSNIRPIFDIASDLWLAQVDLGQIQQVFSNLAINAAQAMPEGGNLYIRLENVQVRAGEMASLQPGKYIKTTVADEGTGIRHSHLERIFDPYFSTKQSGNGLGLATVYSIIDKHGGYIQVDSEPGQGSRFVLYLPASESKKPPEPAPFTENAPAAKGSGRVLIMDDDAMIREVASQMLETMGYQVETAPDGQEALDRYAEAMEAGRRFDLVIMDLTVPGGMGGQEAIARLLDLDPKARALVSSGYAEDPVMAKYREYGFKGIISKPYQIRQLQAVLSQVLTTG